ncbi:MAG TPA: hypothetical protein VFK54_11770 [Candidatus Limnocylindrales bacterium]|nr:hypothetical protein [Candidatus Limnocylindrales bacterium]
MSEREREVGLGRVVEDRTEPKDRRRDDSGDRGVERDSADSFPASDPPTWMSDPATPGEEAEATDDQAS